MFGNIAHAQSASGHLYSVYGVSLRSDFPLPLSNKLKVDSQDELGHIDLGTASADWFFNITRGAEVLETVSSWYKYARLHDGSSYVRWNEVGEFLVPADGKRILCRHFDSATAESFYVYLLGQALSFAFVRQGLEPLHATVIAVDEEALVFLGDSGVGKSTLAACFLAAGYKILTDDLLVLRRAGNITLAYPGPARIKLFPGIARKYMGRTAAAVPMNPFTHKIILPLGPHRTCSTPIPLRAIYSLGAENKHRRGNTARIRRLSVREGFLQLLENTFNRRLVDPDRLDRQFTLMAEIANAVNIRLISYPRVLNCLPTVCEALLRDSRRDYQGMSAIGGATI